MIKSSPPNHTLRYALISVEKTSPPSGMKGDNWCRYVVARDESTIVGTMRGTLNQVTRQAKEFVDNLNARTGSTKTQSAWSPQSKTSPPVKS